MKKILGIVVLGLLLSNNVEAASIVEELTQLNNLLKEGAITKEEFSKAKSILLKTDSKKILTIEEKKVKKKEKKKKSKAIVEKEKKIKVEKTTKKNFNQDLTKSYVSLEEVKEFGNFEMITESPTGMFKSKGKSFSQKANNSMKNMYLIFVQQKNLMEKNPENLMKAMGYFEFFYMNQLKKKKKNIEKFKETWPDIHFSVRKDMKSLYSLNQARKTMRESMGLTLNDDVQVALERYMLMHNFLNQAKKTRIKLTTADLKIKKQGSKLKTNLNSLKKNINLKNEKRIDDKEFNKNIKKNIKLAKSALRVLSSQGTQNDKFYETISKVFIKTEENISNLDLSIDAIDFITSMLVDVEKKIIPREHFQSLDHINIESLPENEIKTLAGISLSMKMQKKEKKELLQNSLLKLSNNKFDVESYVNEIEKNGFELHSVTMTFDDYDNMKRWASKDWANAWKGELPSEIKDTDGNLVQFTEENIQDLKAQLAISTFNEMIDFDKTELQDSVKDNVKEIVQEIQSSGGFDIDAYLNQDFTITLNNYSQLVGNSIGIDINDFKDLTRVANEFYGSDMKVDDYANHWQTAQYMDSTSNWGDVTIGVDLIDQVGSFDAASIAKDLGTDLQTVADSITQAASVGVSTDLEAAAAGLGYSSFADAVAAYNAQYGTNYTTESAKEALGQ